MKPQAADPSNSRGVEFQKPAKHRSPAVRARDAARAVAHTEREIDRAEQAGDYERLRDIRARLVAGGHLEDADYAGTVSRLNAILYRVLGTGHWRERRQYESQPPGRLS